MMATMSDFLGSLESSFAGEASKHAFNLLTDYRSRWNVDVSSSQERVEAAIAEHQREVKNWAEEISFKDLNKSRKPRRRFLFLLHTSNLLPRRQRLSTT